jgi:uncharacterized protein YaaQ
VKLVIAVVQDRDAGAVIDALVQREYRSTRINTQGGFLRRGNATLLIGVEDEQVDDVLALVRDNIHQAGDQRTGAGTAFVLNVARFVRV